MALKKNQQEETRLTLVEPSVEPQPIEKVKARPGKKKPGNRHPNMSGLVHFKKGFDPRRNTKGMPKDAARVRKMIRGLASELITVGKGRDAREVTRLEKLILGMLGSDSPVDRVNILKALYPELFVEKVDMQHSGPPRINVVYIDNRSEPKADKDDVLDGEVKDG